MNLHTHNMVFRTLAGAGALATLAGTGLIAGGCRGDRSDKPPRQFFPDMDDSPKWKPQAQTDFYVDGRTMRPPVRGTVPFGQWPMVGERAGLDEVMADEGFLTGRIGVGEAAKPIAMMPASIQVTPELLARGAERYNIYCSACHGYTGTGGKEGTVGRSFSVAPANLHDPKYMDRNGLNGSDGHIYWVIMNGWNNNMPPYKHSIKPMDGWAIVAHVRALQERNKGRIEDVPEAQRLELQRSRPTVNPTPPAAPSTAPAPAPAPGTGPSTKPVINPSAPKGNS